MVKVGNSEVDVAFEFDAALPLWVAAAITHRAGHRLCWNARSRKLEIVIIKARGDKLELKK